MATLAELVVRLSGDSSKLIAELAKGESATGSFEKKSGANLTRWKTTAVAAAAAGSAALVAAGIAIGKSAISAASDLGESVNAVNKIFEDSAGEILRWGESNATSFGLSQRAFNQMATPLGAMLKNSNIDLQTVASSTIDLTKRAADMASVFNTDVTDALTAIQAGLRGEADPLEKYGVRLSATAVEARALADSGKKFASQLTEQDKALARVNLIMAQTESTAGDFKDTEDGLANAKRQLNAEIEKMQAKLGQKLLPYMEDVVTATRDWIKTNGDEFVEDLGAAIEGAADATGALFKALNNIVSSSPFQITVKVVVEGVQLLLDVINALQSMPEQVIEFSRDRLAEAQRILEGSWRGVNPLNTAMQIAQEQQSSGPRPRRLTVLTDAEVDREIAKFRELGDSMSAAAAAAAGGGGGGGGGGGAAGATRELTSAEKALEAARRDLFAAITRIQDDFMHEQIQSYLRGGQEQVDIVKGQQQEMYAAARAMAQDLMQTFGIDLPTALDVAMDHLKSSAKDLEDQARRTREEMAKVVGSNARAVLEELGSEAFSAGAFGFNLDNINVGGKSFGIGGGAANLQDAYAAVARAVADRGGVLDGAAASSVMAALEAQQAGRYEAVTGGGMGGAGSVTINVPVTVQGSVVSQGDLDRTVVAAVRDSIAGGGLRDLVVAP